MKLYSISKFVVFHYYIQVTFPYIIFLSQPPQNDERTPQQAHLSRFCFIFVLLFNFI